MVIIENQVNTKKYLSPNYHRSIIYGLMIIERFIESHKLTSLRNTDKMFLKDTDKVG